MLDRETKEQLLEKIVATLDDVYQNALKATALAHETATNKNNVAENKYDTLGLEAAYLAHGQSQRVLECQTDLIQFNALKAKLFGLDDPIAVGAFVLLEGEAEDALYFFIGPVAGGLKVKFKQWNILVVTPSSPMGKALLGCLVDDEVEIIIAGKICSYSILFVG